MEETSRFDEATNALRSTAKWLVTALVGVAAALVAGLQLTSLGRLGAADWPRLVLAAAGLAGALGAIGLLIRDTARVLTDAVVTATDLQDQLIDAQLRADPARGALLRQLVGQVDNLREELYGHVAPDLGALQRRLRAANTAAAALLEDPAGHPPEEVDRAVERVRVLRAAAREVAACANYHRLRELTVRSRRRRLAAVGVAVAGIVAFAWASSPPTPERPLVVRVDQPAPAPLPGAATARPTAPAG